MVRTQKQSPSEEKKESPKNRLGAPKKKPAVTGVWPCKINGCNKQFAREADLKRHQRTTKLHSMPGFACPQCDATFTRTDALRRHQKSRHNGVIIEPTEQEKKDGMDEDPKSSGSKSRSRSVTPSGRRKKKDAVQSSSTPAALAQPRTAGPSTGPSSYYRQHTIATNAFGAPSGMVMDHQYPSAIGLPTSATRLHQASWPPQTQWPTDGPPQITYHHIPGAHPNHPGYYQPSPYYRSNGGPMLPTQAHQQQQNSEIPGQLQNGGNPTEHSVSHDHESSRNGTPMQNNVDPRLSQRSRQSNHESTDMDASRSPGAPAPVIDPCLDATQQARAGSDQNIHGPSDDLDGVSLEITQAAMHALIQSAAQTSVAVNRTSGSPESRAVEGQGQVNGHSPRSDANADAKDVNTNDNVDGGDDDLSYPNHTVPQPHGRPEPMDHMLTEDGEPMLNPAELLTQESLASPPPS